MSARAAGQRHRWAGAPGVAGLGLDSGLFRACKVTECSGKGRAWAGVSGRGFLALEAEASVEGCWFFCL